MHSKVPCTVMSAIQLPITTKRSLRFKRFSWNQAGDGTFPPIAALKRARALNEKVSIVGLVERSALGTDKIPALHNDNRDGVKASSDLPDNQPHQETNNLLSKKLVADERVSPVQKKSGKHFGKKRKGVYLGPSWDDEAGLLPTSASAGDMDFDTLLLQMQSQQGDSSESSASLKRKKVNEQLHETHEPGAA